MKSQPSPADKGHQCAHEPCSCVVTAGSGVIAGQQQYCSQGCAEGDGCDHETCHCMDGERNVG